MSVPRTFSTVLTLILFGVLSAGADMPRLQLTLRGWYANLDGDTSVLKKLSGDDIDLDDTLGFDDYTAPEVRLRLQLVDRHALELRYAHLAFDTGEYLIEPLVFDQRLAGVLNRVEGDLELHYIRLGWRYRLIGDGGGPFDLETVADAAIFNGKAEYKLYEWWNPWLVDDEDEYDEWGGLPLLGLSATVRPMDRIELFGEAAGMYAGDYGHAFDAEAGLRFMVTDFFALEAGYRMFRLHGEWEDKSDGPGLANLFLGDADTFIRDVLVRRIYGGDDDEATLTMSGPFVGASLRF